MTCDFGIVAVEHPCMIPACPDHWRLYFRGGGIIRFGYRGDPKTEASGNFPAENRGERL